MRWPHHFLCHFLELSKHVLGDILFSPIFKLYSMLLICMVYSLYNGVNGAFVLCIRSCCPWSMKCQQVVWCSGDKLLTLTQLSVIIIQICSIRPRLFALVGISWLINALPCIFIWDVCHTSKWNVFSSRAEWNQWNAKPILVNVSV